MAGENSSKPERRGKNIEGPVLEAFLDPIPPQLKRSGAAGEKPFSIFISLDPVPPQYDPKPLKEGAPLAQRP